MNGYVLFIILATTLLAMPFAIAQTPPVAAQDKLNEIEFLKMQLSFERAAHQKAEAELATLQLQIEQTNLLTQFFKDHGKDLEKFRINPTDGTFVPVPEKKQEAK